MRYLQLKPLKNKENKKNCDAFDHNLKNKPLLWDSTGIILYHKMAPLV